MPAGQLFHRIRSIREDLDRRARLTSRERVRPIESRDKVTSGLQRLELLERESQSRSVRAVRRRTQDRPAPRLNERQLSILELVKTAQERAAYAIETTVPLLIHGTHRDGAIQHPDAVASRSRMDVLPLLRTLTRMGLKEGQRECSKDRELQKKEEQITQQWVRRSLKSLGPEQVGGDVHLLGTRAEQQEEEEQARGGRHPGRQNSRGDPLQTQALQHRPPQPTKKRSVRRLPRIRSSNGVPVEAWM